MNKLAITIAFAGSGFLLSGQQPSSVSGFVTDGKSALEFADVYLTAQDDSTKIINGTVTDSTGHFRIENVENGIYFLNVRLIGTRKKRLSVAISPSNNTIYLGEIQLETDTKLLNAVEVTEFRSIIEKTDEGFIVRASDNITQIGGTAADLLKNMPGVLVSGDGEITLRGKTPLTLINGRSSGIAGIERSARLEQIPASSIERIEIIHNPSAKYDADAEGGIINIILKTNNDTGTNGAFAVGAGFGERYRLNASILLNRKTKRWNFGIAYDNWYTTRTRSARGDRINFDLPDQYFLSQRRFDERLIFYQNAKANIDYSANEKSRLSFEALWAFPGEDNHETLRNNFLTSENDFAGQNRRHSDEIRRSQALEFSLNYAKEFADPDHTLHVTISNTFGDDKENTDITTLDLDEQDNPGSNSLQRTHTYQKTNLSNLSVDYDKPVSPNGNIETGYKGIARFLGADFQRANHIDDQFVMDPLKTGIFNFKEQIHALYSQYTGWTGSKQQPKWKFILGLRAEQVWNNGSIRTDTKEFRHKYFNLFPSGSIFYYTKNENNLKVSYSRRINRPSLGDLNPFIDITDSLNQHSGNSNLKPELVNSFELGYYHSMEKASFSFSSFYRTVTNAILAYTTLDENGVALTQPVNIGNARNYGIEAITTYNPFSWWSVSLSFSAYNLTFSDNGTPAGLSTNQINWYSKVTNNLNVFKRTKLQVTGSYTSPIVIPQGESIAVYYVDLGLQHTIIKGKGRLGLTATDMFNTQEYGVITSDHNFYFSRIFKRDTRAVMLTLGYTFGTSFRETLMENKFKNE